MADFLLEIGLEEVPARMLAGAQAELLRRVSDLVQRERLLAPDAPPAMSFSTPRRLAVLFPGVLERQEDLTEEVLGPAVKIAFKDGAPGPAAAAFAKKSGVSVEALRVVETPKGDYVQASVQRSGRGAREVLAAELPRELAAIYWAKNMHWRAGKPERFVRPVRWLIALLADEIVPVSFGGYTAGRETFGHRVLFGAEPIRTNSPETYLGQLSQSFVMADVERRRHTIRKALDHVCRTLPQTRWREDHELVDKMTHLTEWPSVIAGGFESEFLSLPEEVLVTVMRDHQNYFAVEDQAGKLAPHFLAVLNTVPDEASAAVIRHGNERVLRARFNDARFFWDFDQRILLEERVTLLADVTFHRDLGSYALKSTRVAEIAETLAGLSIGHGVGVDQQSLGTACRLAKTDLTTELVKEFTELQGQVGGLYARAQGVSACAADAIYAQYLPVSMDDPIPRTREGQILSLADKMDTVAQMFALGLEPSGSKDPFALRRAANGIVKILAESELPLTIDALIEATEVAPPVAEKIRSFFGERLEFYLRDAKGQAYDVVKAVLAVSLDDVRDAVARAEAVTAVRAEDASTFLAVCAGFKRMQNILGQARDKGEALGASVEAQWLRQPAEEAFAAAGALAAQQMERLRAEGQYKEAMTLVASLRPAVDRFFDEVVVMDPDAAVRGNRLALLQRMLQDFGGVADFSEIVVAG